MLLGNNMDAPEEQVPDHQPIELVLFCTVAAPNSLSSRKYNSAVMFLDPVHSCKGNSVTINQEKRGSQNEAREGYHIPGSGARYCHGAQQLSPPVAFHDSSACSLPLTVRLKHNTTC